MDVLRSCSSAIFVLLFPMVLLLLVGFVFQKGHPFEQRTVVIVDATGGSGPMKAFATYEEIRVERARTEEQALGKLRAKMASAVIVVPAGDAPPRLLVGSREQVLGRGLLSVLPSETRLETVEASSWGYVHYLFPGMLTFSAMLSGLFATGYTLVLYRQNRFLKKLATTPMPKLVFVLALVAGRALLVLLQIALVVAAAALAFDVPFTASSAASTALVSMAGFLSFLGVGFVLAAVVKSESLVVDLVSAVNVPLVFFSEIFFPLDALPGPLAAIGEVLPSTAMVRLIRGVVLYGDVPASEVGAGLGVIAVWTVATFAIGLKLFRWHD
jgi:ABC-2 type transport system permease protein